MLLSNLLKSKIEKKNRLGALVLVAAFELMLGIFVWNHTKPRSVILGFLVKNGNSYVLAWKDEETGYESHSYPSLKDALQVAQGDLKLAPGHNPIIEQEVEHVWLDDRSGAYVLLWKTNNFSFLNQLTFQSHDDALFFENAFRRGSYTPSPFGHSVLFVPTKTN